MEHSVGPQGAYTRFTFVASFKADPERWSTFKQECAARGVSICHVQDALMEAWIQGQKATATVIKPVVVNLTMQHVVKRPRRMKNLQDVILDARRQTWPPNCEHADVYIKSTREVGCLDLRDHIKLEKCWRCFLTRVRNP